jgi:lipopolysaccharide biosynthesis glycosyltransferase
MRERTIITATDDNYVLPMLTMIYSADRNKTKSFSLTVGYVRDKLSEENQILISKCLFRLGIKFRLLPVDLTDEFKDNHHISMTSYARLVMADLAKGSVLWLDADLICHKGWDRIYEVSKNAKSEYLVFGVKDPIVGQKSFQTNTRNHAVLRMKADYFNAGVLFIDCDLWREKCMQERWRIAHKNYANLGFQYSDQCILNYISFQSFAHLPTEYNSFPISATNERNLEAKISHFAGPIKPWNFRHQNLFVVGNRNKRKSISEYLRIRDEFINLFESIDPETSKALRKMSNLLSSKKGTIKLMIEYSRFKKNTIKSS